MPFHFRKQKLLLVTTYPSSQLEKISSNISAWLDLDDVTLLSLIHNADLPSVRNYYSHQQFSDYKWSKHLIHLYPVLTPCPNRAPFLSEVLSCFSKYPEFDLYAFVNADIEPNLPSWHQSSLSTDLSSIPSRPILYLAHRQDYLESRENLAPYLQGFDFFLLNKSLLNSLDFSLYSDLRIGQVGWDYLFPLSINAFHVYKASNPLLLHRIHPTGSSSSWESAILQILQLIHPSWLQLSNTLLRLLFPLTKRISHSLLMRSSRKTRSMRLLTYFYTRIIFYTFVVKLLSRIPQYRPLGLCTNHCETLL